MRKQLFPVVALCFVGFFFSVRAVQAQPSGNCSPIFLTLNESWFEDFEGYPHNAAVPLEECWDTPQTLVVDNGTSPFVYTGYPYACHSGSNSLELKRSPVMVVLPEFANAINTLVISFWGNTSAQNASAAGTLVLGVITDVTNPSSFIPVDTIPATAFGRTGQDAPYTNFMGYHTFENIVPQDGMRIALRLTNTNRSWNLDDITVFLNPSAFIDSLPYIANLASGSWRLNNGDAANYWTVGIPDGVGDTALFITNDGITAGYNIAVASTVMAEKALMMPASDSVRVDFDVRVGGESHFDFLKVFLAPAEVEFAAGQYNNAQSQSQFSDYALDFTPFKPQGSYSEGYPHIFNLSDDVVHVRAAMANPAPNAPAKLVFLWRNDNTTGTQPGAVVSHVTVVEGALCPETTGLQVTGQSNQDVTVTWDGDPDVAVWDYWYVPVDSDSIVTGSVDTNSFTIVTELASHGGITFWVRVRANCGNGNVGDWSDTLSAKILNEAVADRMENAVVLYPNPAKEVVNVQCTMNNVQKDGELHLFDVYGKLLRMVPVTSEITPVNISGLADGIYFVRVTTDRGTVTKTFVKK